ncbi:MAG: hypothetical protein M1318_05050 [Firmicutes bacterium]|nr:hypothetical protein [Bacillota bacterium]
MDKPLIGFRMSRDEKFAIGARDWIRQLWTVGCRYSVYAAGCRPLRWLRVEL